MIWLIVGAVVVIFVVSVAYGYWKPESEAETAASPPPAPQAGPAPTSVVRPARPGKRRALSSTAGGGGLGTGLLALGGGLFLHSHYGPTATICQSGVGALGQTLEPHVQSGCSTATMAAELGTILTIGGAVIVFITIVVIILMLFEASKEAEA